MTITSCTETRNYKNGINTINKNNLNNSKIYHRTIKNSNSMINVFTNENIKALRSNNKVMNEYKFNMNRKIFIVSLNGCNHCGNRTEIKHNVNKVNDINL